MIDFIVERENSQDKSNGKIKNNVEKEINRIVETNRNKLDIKSNGNVDYNNEKKNNYSRIEQLKYLHRRHHKKSIFTKNI